MKYNKFPISFALGRILSQCRSWQLEMECNALFVCRFHTHKRHSNIIPNLFLLLHASGKAKSVAQFTASFHRTVQPLPILCFSSNSGLEQLTAQLNLHGDGDSWPTWEGAKHQFVPNKICPNLGVAYQGYLLAVKPFAERQQMPWGRGWEIATKTACMFYFFAETWYLS